MQCCFKLFCQRWNNVDKHTSAQLSFSTKFQRWWIWWIIFIAWLTGERRLISDTPRAGFEPAQNLSLNFLEWSRAVVITTPPQRWNNIGSSTLNRRNSIGVVSTLFCQRWNNVNKCTSAQISFQYVAYVLTVSITFSVYKRNFTVQLFKN